jgi:hypothetical protein
MGEASSASASEIRLDLSSQLVYNGQDDAPHEQEDNIQDGEGSVNEEHDEDYESADNDAK